MLEPFTKDLKNFVFYFIPVNSPNIVIDGTSVVDFQWKD